jgi:beta-aspartyl-dipeptidase (metallo-type)
MFLLRGASVHAPEPLGTPDVLVGGGKILAIGQGLSVPAELAPVVDLEGHVLVPGLVDVHVHLTGGGGEGGAETRVPPVVASALAGNGVTTAVGLLGTDGTTRSIRELLACARALDALGLTALCYTGSYEVPPPTLTGSVRGDLVHVDRIVAVGELAISDHRSSQPTFDEVLRVAADAHVGGMMAKKAGLVHLHLGDGPRGLELLWRAKEVSELPLRVWHPTHVNRNPSLFAESVRWAESGGWVDVSAFPPPYDDGTVDPVDAVLRLLDAGCGARTTLSSDAGGCLPVFDDGGALLSMDVGSARGLLHTVRALVHRGVSLEDALRPVTATPAALYRLPAKGHLRVGADADLLALAAGDLSLRHVWARGVPWVRDGVVIRRGLFEG